GGGGGRGGGGGAGGRVGERGGVPARGRADGDERVDRRDGAAGRRLGMAREPGERGAPQSHGNARDRGARRDGRRGRGEPLPTADSPAPADDRRQGPVRPGRPPVVQGEPAGLARWLGHDAASARSSASARSLATARATVLFTVPGAMPSSLAIWNSVRSR